MDGNYKRPPLKPETYNLLKEQKPDGVTFDHYIRQLMDVER